MYFAYLFGGIALIVLLLFGFMAIVLKVLDREEKDSAFAQKMDKFREKATPFWNMGHNIFGWVVALVILYFIITLY